MSSTKYLSAETIENNNTKMDTTKLYWKCLLNEKSIT